MSEFHNLRASYLRGEIEADEFEAGLDELLSRNPEIIGRCGDPLPTEPEDIRWGPGQVIPYRPTARDWRRAYGLETWQLQKLNAMLREDSHST